MDALVAVLCLRISGWSHYEDNIHRANLLFGTLSLHWNSEQALSVYVIVRPEELEIAKRTLLEWPNIRFVFIEENQLIDGISDYPFGGWTKQQLLKLAIGAQLPTEFYLTLDPDIFCCRPVGGALLVRDGKAMSGWERKSLHTNWWEGAARTLSLPELQDEYVLGVTPNVLSRSIATGLVAHCGTLSSKPWWEYLISLHHDHGVDSWTEYSLYNTYGNAAGLIDRFHWNAAFCKNFPKLISDNSMWDKAYAQNWNPANSFGAAADAYFTVCQSTQMIETREILEALRHQMPTAICDRLHANLEAP